MRVIVPVILSGGSGTRLWPLSRGPRPKQFLPLVSEHSLFQETVLRARAIQGEVARPLVVCNEAHRFLVAEQLLELGSAAQAVILEPAGRNTAPAVAAAALIARDAAAAGEQVLLAVFPADHVIGDREAFLAAAKHAVDAAADGHLVTFGVVPDRPETGYGYILRGPAHNDWFELREFVEKPDLATAEGYLASGRYLWNSGMFVFAADVLLKELARHAPKVLEACTHAVTEAARDPDFIRLGARFLDCPSISIDYAVMEKTDRAAVVPLAAAWNDVGSWSALHDALPKDDRGNVLRGEVLASRCKNSYISASARTVVALGLDNVVIVETDDAVLVMSRDEAQNVRQVVEALSGKKLA